MRSLEGYSSWGCKESEHDWATEHIRLSLSQTSLSSLFSNFPSRHQSASQTISHLSWISVDPYATAILPNKINSCMPCMKSGPLGGLTSPLAFKIQRPTRLTFLTSFKTFSCSLHNFTTQLWHIAVDCNKLFVQILTKKSHLEFFHIDFSRRLCLQSLKNDIASLNKQLNNVSNICRLTHQETMKMTHHLPSF